MLFGAILDREEAITILRWMTLTHDGDVLNYVDIVPPSKTNNTLSDGYQLHVKGAAYHSLKDLENRVKKYGLVVKEENEKVIIYKPKRIE
jgi:hypothetical protein